MHTTHALVRLAGLGHGGRGILVCKHRHAGPRHALALVGIGDRPLVVYGADDAIAEEHVRHTRGVDLVHIGSAIHSLRVEQPLARVVVDAVPLFPNWQPSVATPRIKRSRVRVIVAG